MRYIAAYDAGTTAVKGTLVTPEGGIGAELSEEISTVYEGGHVEQDPRQWWQAFCAVTARLMAACPEAELCGVVLSGQMQDLICLDANGEPVGNAILYSDGRAAMQAEALRAAVGDARIFAITGNGMDGSLPLPKLMWLREAQPERYARTAHVLTSSKDYIVLRLTGAYVGDTTAGSIAGAMDIVALDWSPELLRAAGVDPAFLPRLLPPHGLAGSVTAEAAEATGIPQGTPVFCGIGDAGATTLASGISAPGDVNINLGTSGWVATVSDRVREGVINLAAAEVGTYINVVPFLNAGNVHHWIAGVLTDEQAPDYAAVSALLKDTAPGSNGVLFLPYLVGERFPVPDPTARGCYVGITPATSRGDMARACLEGVAFSLRQGMEQLGEHPDAVSVIGGGAREPVWCELLSGVLGCDVIAFSGAETLPALAVAAIALRGLGELSGYAEFTAGLRGTGRSVCYRATPDRVETYHALYERFLKLYTTVRPLF